MRETVPTFLDRIQISFILLVSTIANTDVSPKVDALEIVEIMDISPGEF